MPDSSLCFTSIAVRRLQGIEHGIEVADLQPGVNVIYGANASGKTTLARSIRAVLWPDGATSWRPQIDAGFEYDGSGWQVKLDGTRYDCRRGTAVHNPPLLPEEAHRDRYHLYLHELLARTDGHSDFAEAIMREMGGGFDIAAAAKELGFSYAPRRDSRTAETKAVRRALEKLEEAQQRQREVAREQDALMDLERKKNGAEEALERAAAYRQAIVVLQSQADRKDAEAAVEAFDSRMADIREDDAERLENLNQQIEDFEDEIRRARAAQDEAARELEDNILTGSELPDDLLETLRGEIERLREAEQSYEQGRSELAEARQEEEETWRQLEAGLDREAVAELSLPSITELERALKPVGDLRARLGARDMIEVMFEDVEAGKSAEDLRTGLEALHRWMQADAREAAGGTPLAIPAIGALTFVLGIALLFVTSGAALYIGAALALSGLVVAVYGYTSRDPGAETGRTEKATRRRDFEATDLEPPPKWTANHVRRRSDEVLSELRRAEFEAEVAAERVRWDKTWERLEGAIKKAEGQMAEYLQSIGLDGEALRENELFWLMRRLADWQKAHARAGARAAGQEEMNESIQKHLAAVNERMAPFGLNGCESSAEADAAREQLVTAAAALEGSTANQSNAAGQEKRARKRKEEAENELSALLDRVRVGEDEHHVLGELCARRQDYREAVKTFENCESVYTTQLAALKDMAGYDETMLDESPSRLEGLLEEAKERGEQREWLADQISRIGERVDEQQRGHAIEELQAEYELALDELARRRSRDYENAVGAVLADVVQEVTRERDRPPVLTRAAHLFSQITKGRYELKLELDGEKPSFQAVDTTDQWPRAIDALSSGTKIQLLLAVRVAFVETLESGCRLPLVLDETLANSDDVKAESIIEALSTVCADDRQIIYLTAQEDEVRKWDRVLSGGDIPFQIVTLTDRPLREALHQNGSVTPARPESIDIDSIEGVTHEAYYELAGVPHWSPRRHLGALHLWYLIDDVPSLHRLRDRGFTNWGPLKNYGKRSNGQALVVEEAVYRKAEALAEAVGHWQKLWKVGRGKRVHRQVLEDSGAVTDTFIDRVAELAEEVDGVAETLLSELKDSAVSGFRTNKIEDLEQYFVEHGYLDDQPVLERTVVWQRVVAEIGTQLDNGIIDTDDIEMLFERLR